MKYFTIPELIQSNTARILGINNHPSEQASQNLIELADTVLDRLRERWGKPIIVTSGYRSEPLNKALGGSKNSQHIKGQAADIKARNGQTKQLYELAVSMVESGEIKVGQLINESNYSWIHISLPNSKHKNEILNA